MKTKEEMDDMSAETQETIARMQQELGDELEENVKKTHKAFDGLREEARKVGGPRSA